MVDSRKEYDIVSRTFKKVRSCHLGEALAHNSFVCRRSMEYEGSEQGRMEWILARDKLTRGKATSLYSEGFPWGEALLQAISSDCMVAWQITKDRAMVGVITTKAARDIAGT